MPVRQHPQHGRPDRRPGKRLTWPLSSSIFLGTATAVARAHDQDSSEYRRVVVPGDATGTRIVVRVSKFGSLALVCADNPGAFLGTGDAQVVGELDEADLAKVRCHV